MSQATEAMAKGPAPIKDNKAVTAGIPNTTSMLTRLLELSWFKTLVRFVFSSIEVVCNAFEFVEDAGRGGIVTSILAISANIIEGLNVGLYLTIGAKVGLVDMPVGLMGQTVLLVSEYVVMVVRLVVLR